jgi:DNA-binding SARP family transcriptional activator
LSAAFEQFKSTWLIKESVPSIDAAISALRRRVVERLAQDALDRGEIGLAIGLAEDLRLRDVNDETAYELLIRAYVRSGNNAGALREYRILQRPLDKQTRCRAVIFGRGADSGRALVLNCVV